MPATLETLTDEQLVADAVEARLEAEETELEASPSRWREADRYAELSGRSWTQARIAEACGTNQQLVSVLCRMSTGYPVRDERPTFWHAYAEVTGEKQRLTGYSSATPEWGTPQELFDALNAEFGFTLDVCATKELAKCKRFFSPEQDGLAQKWRGVCWMNPPYGDEIPAWIEKAASSADEGATVVCLVPARTDTAWWWDFVSFAEVRFLRGRLRFDGATAGAPFPSAVVIFGRPVKTEYWDWRA